MSRRGGTIRMKKPIPGINIHTLPAMLTPSSTAVQPTDEPDAQNQNCRVARPDDDAFAGTLAQTAVEAVVSSGLVHTALGLVARSAAPALSSAFLFAMRLARKGPRF